MLRTRPSVPMFTSRLGAVFVTVLMKPTSARSSACSRSFWSARAAAAVTASRAPARRRARGRRRSPRHASPFALDELDGAALVAASAPGRLALRIDPAGASEATLPVEPVHDVELGIAQRAGERAAQRLACLERDDELGHRRAREPRAQDAEQEGRPARRRTRRRRAAGTHRRRDGRDLVADRRGARWRPGRRCRRRSPATASLPHRRTRAAPAADEHA